MHVVKHYQLAKDKTAFLAKFKALPKELIVEVDKMIKLIDSFVLMVILTEHEVNMLADILNEMFAAEIEDEIQSMITAYEKLSKLKIRIWKRSMKKL